MGNGMSVVNECSSLRRARASERGEERERGDVSVYNELMAPWKLRKKTAQSVLQ